MVIPRPGAGEYAPHYGTYIEAAVGTDAVAILRAQRATTAALLGTIPESRAGFRYAEGKWSLREVVGHLSDAERIFSYRLLRFARGDDAALAGFDENAYVPAGRFEQRSLAEVGAEFLSVRDATLALVQGLPAESLLRQGLASGKSISVRALAWVCAGHETHHIRVLKERYLGAGA